MSEPRPAGGLGRRAVGPQRARRPDGLARRYAAAVGAAAGVVLVVGAALALLGSEGEAEPAGSGGGQILHVHGLGVDPRDEVLYAGTHHGLFRLPESGEVSRVSERVQDFMGFTVAGPGHFLASGHPGPGEAAPAALGLIESTDGGRSWRSLSLAGEADFHSLEARHGLVYGLNALTGEFMVSDDKRTWDVRSRPPIADFAVSPEDPDVVVATTREGLAQSVDGGRTFEPIRSAPLLLLVSWADDGGLVGADPAGAVYVSRDAGRTWQQRARLGAAPHALTATSGEEIYAAVDGAILWSRDGGRSFDVRHSG